ncbi:MAG: tRNA uridine-5-carboxymethylaminomethyl(34) synthesis GTPase MnmE [Oscillospiraceae bacterium]|jgi:tRNA modification GTPase|nr:tRNA uridine-5-carboxymethylaminomethyl(34) synthesis GTPase MnmE [Oscillospiraceae bacterium]
METIAAISTPIGVGSIGLVRVSGGCAIKIADSVFQAADGEKLSGLLGYRAKYGTVVCDGDYLDEAVATVFRAPKSYTGEDVVEISCHGGIFLTRCLLRSVLEAGAKFADPGEFSKRAFLNGKISLEKAESIMDLIASNSEISRKISFSAFDGTMGKKINEIKSFITDVYTMASAGIDFPDQDIDQEFVKEKIIDTDSKVSKLINSYSIGSVIKHGLKAVIIGSTNVGKSTLMNLLSQREKSIVTEIPGTTRDLIEEKVLIGDIELNLIDTAGIRETSEIIENLGKKKALEIANTAELIFMLFDSSRNITNSELELLKKFNKEKIIAIFNKCDLESAISEHAFNEVLKFSKQIVKMSANIGYGLKELKSAVYDFVNFTGLESESLIITSERQFDILRRVSEALKNAISCKSYLDLVAENLNEALKILNQFSGENVNEAVIDSIFSKFCVGK